MSTSFSFWYLEYSLNNIQIHGLNGGAILTTGSEVIFCVKLYLLITGFHVSLALHLLETSGAVADSICTASSFFLLCMFNSCSCFAFFKYVTVIVSCIRIYRY